MSRTQVLTLALLLMIARSAGAESWVPPYCTCNDDCKYKFPYTGVCVSGYGTTYCGYSYQGPGIPCEAGVPHPDVFVPCICNDQCTGSLAGPYCVFDGAKTRCASTCGPGIKCDAGVPHDLPWQPCTCNAECWGNGSCNNTDRGLFCTGPGPGIPCATTDDAVPQLCRCDSDCAAAPSGPFCSSQSGRCSPSGPGTPCSSSDGGPSLPGDGGGWLGTEAPQELSERGCSCQLAAAPDPGTLPLLLLLAALLAVRRRSRRSS